MLDHPNQDPCCPPRFMRFFDGLLDYPLLTDVRAACARACEAWVVDTPGWPESVLDRCTADCVAILATAMPGRNASNFLGSVGWMVRLALVTEAIGRDWYRRHRVRGSEIWSEHCLHLTAGCAGVVLRLGGAVDWAMRLEWPEAASLETACRCYIATGGANWTGPLPSRGSRRLLVEDAFSSTRASYLVLGLSSPPHRAAVWLNRAECGLLVEFLSTRRRLAIPEAGCHPDACLL